MTLFWTLNTDLAIEISFDMRYIIQNPKIDIRI